MGGVRELRELLVSKVGELVAAAWIARKTSTLKELDVVCHYTRAVRMLKTEEKAALKSACIAYPEAFRLAFPGRKIVPPKIHCIEKQLCRLSKSMALLAFLVKMVWNHTIPLIPGPG